MPALTRVAILWNPTNPAKRPEWREMQVTAQALGLTIPPALLFQATEVIR